MKTLNSTKSKSIVMAIIFGSAMLVMLLLVMNVACGGGKKQLLDITTSQADSVITSNLQNPQFKILDVRTPAEFETGHLSGSINIDFRSADFESKIGSLQKDGKYLVYCRTGHRSASAMSVMKSKNFIEVYNMLGGITKWNEEKRATVQ